MTILLMDAVCLTDHDKYVCHNYRDPFRYRVKGYREKDMKDGCIVTPPSTPREIKSSAPTAEAVRAAKEAAEEANAAAAAATQLSPNPADENVDWTKSQIPLSKSSAPPTMGSPVVSLPLKEDVNPTLSPPITKDAASRGPSLNLELKVDTNTTRPVAEVQASADVATSFVAKPASAAREQWCASKLDACKVSPPL